MTTLTIPKKLAAKGDLVLLPRAEYEALKSRAMPEYVPTKTDLKALMRGRRTRAARKMISAAELKRELARRR